MADKKNVAFPLKMRAFFLYSSGPDHFRLGQNTDSMTRETIVQWPWWFNYENVAKLGSLLLTKIHSIESAIDSETVTSTFKVALNFKIFCIFRILFVKNSQ